MTALHLLVLLSLATAATARHTSRHYFGQNGTLPRGLINLGTVNVDGFGEVFVVTGNPGNVDKLDNGFRLHGGGGGRFTPRLFLARLVIYYITYFYSVSRHVQCRHRLRPLHVLADQPGGQRLVL